MFPQDLKENEETFSTDRHFLNYIINMTSGKGKRGTCRSKFDLRRMLTHWRMTTTCRVASSGNSHDASPSHMGEKCCLHPHNRVGSKIVARDKIHAQINCTDTNSDGAEQIDDLAYSLALQLLGPC